MTDADYAKMATLTGARNNPPQAAKLPAAEVAEKTARGLLAKMDQVGTDVQFLSPRPYLQMHSLGPAGVPLHWARYCRSEERRVGTECVRTCRSRWSPYL